ncbi:MAG: ATP-grasp domain-containing protein, partial [Sphingopyxis sp.]
GILSDGEFSLFFFDGKFSHAIVKRPAAGDFRVQEQYGGRETVWEGNDEAQALAAAALAAAPARPVYARVDMVGDAAGVLHIMELELIEPSLFLHFADDKGAAFGRAVAGATLI